MLAFALSARAQYKKPIRLNYSDYDLGKRLRFGFSIGFNTMDFKIRNGKGIEVSPDLKDTTQYFADVSHLVPGFNVNAVADFRLSENFHLRFLPGYAFGQRNLNFFFPAEKLETQMKIESSFIELPVILKYSAERVNNVRPYLIMGGNLRLDLAAYKKLNVQQGVLLRLSKADMYYEIGFGTDFFLEYFKFSVEFKYSIGLLNVLSRDYADGAENYVQAIEKVNSRIFVIAFHFE
jgi:hypothetical protein